MFKIINGLAASTHNLEFVTFQLIIDTDEFLNAIFVILL